MPSRRRLPTKRPSFGALHSLRSFAMTHRAYLTTWVTEVETQITIACRLDYISDNAEIAFLEETTAERKMILAFVHSLSGRSQ